jgi:hypothetical protein
VDDLAFGLLAVVVAIFVISLAIMVACCVLAATLAGTAVWAVAVGVQTFGRDFGSSIWSRGGSRRAPKDPEPAFELYVLGQLLADFRFALVQAAAALTGVRSRLSALADGMQEGATMPLAIGLVLGGWLGTAVAAIIGGLVGVCVGLIAALASTISWLLILGLRLVDSIRRRVRRASYECPVDHERFALPVYLCPVCGAQHARLVPGRWGIFKRECACGGTALPTTVVNGRQRVPQRCPSGHSMSGFLGFAENLPIAIAGGPSSGKSALLAGALIELDDPFSGLALEPLSESRDDYSRLVDAMRSGVPPAKTTRERPPALVAEIQGAGAAKALYAYDVAGEVYGAEDKVRGLRFLARSAGIVLMVDPFSIPQVAGDHSEDLAKYAQQILPSSEDPMRVLERLLSTLKESGARIGNVPLAVVVAKTDACGIDREIEALAASHGSAGAPREWLAKNGAGNLVRTVEHEFKQVGWFSVSALGRMPSPGDTRAFLPRGALAPLLWTLERHHIRTASDGATPSHDARRLVGGAADFPLPSTRMRAAQAAGATAVVALAVAAPIAIAAAFGGQAGGAAGHVAFGHSVPETSNGSPSSPSSPSPAHRASEVRHRPPAAARSRRRSRAVRRTDRRPRHGHVRPQSSASASDRVSSAPSQTGAASRQPTASHHSEAAAPSGGAGGGLQGRATPSGQGSGPSGGLHGSSPQESGSGEDGLSGSAGGK